MTAIFFLFLVSYIGSKQLWLSGQTLLLLVALEDRRLVQAVGKSEILFLNLFCSFLPFTPFSMSSSSLTSIYIICSDQDLSALLSFPYFDIYTYREPVFVVPLLVESVTLFRLFVCYAASR